MNFSVIDEAIGIENICNLYKTDYGDTILEIKAKNISTGKLVYMDFMKVVGNKIFWHPNALQVVDPKFSPFARLKIKKIIKNRAFL